LSTTAAVNVATIQETTEHITGACRALSQDDYTHITSSQHRSSRVLYQMWTIEGQTNTV
jgi:hypothetical protein